MSDLRSERARTHHKATAPAVERNLEDVRRIRVDSGPGPREALLFVLETLSAHYILDARGRMQSRRDGGVPPRFVLGRTPEGCVWRFRSDVSQAVVRRVARLAAREPGAAFDGELPAPPDRIGPIELCFDEPVVAVGRGGAAPRPRESRAQRMAITRDGVIIGELWWID